MKAKNATLLLLAGWLVLAACGSDDQPASRDAAPDISSQSPGLIGDGEALYQANCAECHGSDLRGTDKGPSHLSVVYEPNHHGDAAFFLAVQRGSIAHHWDFGDMPPVEGLTEEDVTAIVAYVREQQQISGFEPYPP